MLKKNAGYTITYELNYIELSNLNDVLIVTNSKKKKNTTMQSL